MALFAPQIGLRNVAEQRRPNSSKWTANMQPAKISDTGGEKTSCGDAKKKVMGTQIEF